MITVRCPVSFAAERAYVVDVVLRQFLGLEYTLDFSRDASEWSLTQGDGRSVKLPDSFFAMPESDWLNPSPSHTSVEFVDVANEPYSSCAMESRIPKIYGVQDRRVMAVESETVTFSIDIFGAAFFLLTRYEEAISTEKDVHSRFPAEASIAFKENFLHRPIIDEYTELLWWAVIHIWPESVRRERRFCISPTFDVDLPFGLYFSNAKYCAGRVGAEIVKRGNWSSAIQYLLALPFVKFGAAQFDPANCFKYILKACEDRNLVSFFHIICDAPAGLKDCNYSIAHPKIREIMSEIVSRGHALGLHGSYLSFDNKEQLRREFGKLQEACRELDYAPQRWQSRQHYLRWATPASFAALDEAGLEIDSTMGYADTPGFRCGTCHSYSVYDVKARRPLDLIERPMIAMEVSVIYHPYLALGYDEVAEEAFLRTKRACKKYNGDFVLNWHNNNLINFKQRQLFEKILDG